jgi:hypothetical protein
MAGRDANVIERELERLTDGLSKELLGSASAPLSYSITCFPELGESACVTNAIFVVGKGNRGFACTNKQADELETAWNAVQSGGGKSTKAADAVLVRRLSAMRSELAKSITQSVCNHI